MCNEGIEAYMIRNKDQTLERKKLKLPLASLTVAWEEGILKKWELNFLARKLRRRVGRENGLRGEEMSMVCYLRTGFPMNERHERHRNENFDIQPGRGIFLAFNLLSAAEG